MHSSILRNKCQHGINHWVVFFLFLSKRLSLRIFILSSFVCESIRIGFVKRSKEEKKIMSSFWMRREQESEKKIENKTYNNNYHIKWTATYSDQVEHLIVLVSINQAADQLNNDADITRGEWVKKKARVRMGWEGLCSKLIYHWHRSIDRSRSAPNLPTSMEQVMQLLHKHACVTSTYDLITGRRQSNAFDITTQCNWWYSQ